jgi:hypothetical protein
MSEVKSGSLVALDIRDLNTKRDFYIIHNKKRKFMPLMEKFHDFILGKRPEIGTEQRA